MSTPPDSAAGFGDDAMSDPLAQFPRELSLSRKGQDWVLEVHDEPELWGTVRSRDERTLLRFAEVYAEWRTEQARGGETR